MDNATFQCMWAHSRTDSLRPGVNYCTYHLILQTLTKLRKEESWLKSRIRKELEQFDCLRDAPLACFTFCVLTALADAIVRIG